MTAAAGTVATPADEAAPRVAAERLRLLLRSPTVLVGLAIILA